MKRKVLAMVLCVALLLSCASCGSSSMSYSDYNLDDYVKVGTYKGIKVKPYVVSVSQSEVDAAVKKVLESAKKDTEVKQGAVLKKDDTANIDYKGMIDGKAFEGGTAKAQDLTLGSGKFIEGFEDGLIGKKVGDSVTLNLTFPKNYGSKELAGKKCVFEVKINSAKRPQTPTAEEYVKSNDKYKSVSDLRKATEKKLKADKEKKAKDEQKTSVWSEVLENSEAKDYPKREVEAYKKFNSEQVDAQASQYGYTREQMLKAYGYSTEKDFAAANEEASKLRVKQEMLLEVIAKKEGIKYTDAEAEAMLQKLEKTGFDKKSITKSTGRNFDDYIRMELLYDKVLDYLLDNAKVSGSAKEY